MLKHSKSFISIVPNCGLGNILFFIANGLHLCCENNCKLEVLFVNANKENNKLLAYKGAHFYSSIYVTFGGHALPKYTIEEFFPKIKFEFNVTFDSYSANKTCHYNFDSFNKGKHNIYNCSGWNCHFLKHLPEIKDKLQFNNNITQAMDFKHKTVDFSSPCIHLRLGSQGDFTILARRSPIEKIYRYASTLKSEFFYVFADNYAAACELNFSGIKSKPIIIDEPCCLTTLYLMSRFKHMLLSKSTFAIWAGLLSDNSEITVFAEHEDDLHCRLPTWRIF